MTSNSTLQNLKIDRWIIEGLLFAFFVAGIFGAVYITDDLDPIKMITVSYIGVPGTIFFYTCRALYPQLLKNRKLLLTSLLILSLAYVPAYISIINAATSPSLQTFQRVVKRFEVVRTDEVRSGGLGLPYAKRF